MKRPLVLSLKDPRDPKGLQAPRLCPQLQCNMEQPMQPTDLLYIQINMVYRLLAALLYLKLCPTFSALLNFHLLNSVQCSEAIMAGSSYETLEGNNIEIGCDGESLTVNGIKMVRKKDIVTTNGVIHLIDQVLMPDSG